MTEPSKSDLTRRKILDAGKALVVRRGFGGVGLSRILAESGVPKGSFYYYFPSKEAFGEALLTDYVEGYLAKVDALCAAGGTGAERLAAFWQAWLGEEAAEGCGPAGGIASECLVVKLGAEVADLSDPMRRILDEGVAALTGRLASLLEEGARDGSLRPSRTPLRDAQMLYAKWLGAAILAKLAQDQAPLRRALDDTMTSLAPSD